MFLSCALILFATGLFQGGEASPGKSSQSPEWPKLAKAKQDELHGKMVLYKRASAERAKELLDEVVGFGKGAVPQLLAPLPKAEPEWRARLLGALDGITGADDVARLLHSANSKALAVRQYAVRRASQFAASEHAESFVKVQQDPDPDVRFYAALGASRAGSVAGIPVLLEMGAARWVAHKKEMISALAGVRGGEATKLIRPLLDSKEDDMLILGLRLLSAVGDASVVFPISSFLDSTNHLHKEEAINALRGIVDQAPPLEEVSAFDLIDQAKQWKERLKTWKPSR